MIDPSSSELFEENYISVEVVMIQEQCLCLCIQASELWSSTNWPIRLQHLFMCIEVILSSCWMYMVSYSRIWGSNDLKALSWMVNMHILTSTSHWGNSLCKTSVDSEYMSFRKCILCCVSNYSTLTLNINYLDLFIAKYDFLRTGRIGTTGTFVSYHYKHCILSW